MNRYVRAALPVLCCLTLVLQGCSLTFDATKLGVPVTMASSASAPAQGTPFHVTRRAVYGLWGLVKISEPSLRKALASQLVGGQGVADLRIRVRTKFTDLLITGLTLGLLSPRAVTFDGVIVGQ
ncbi:MAG TPA: hypothetical protein VNH46_09085 [Gemmatimonadales bacterium]|nr:hypothetical protein [Gemmatimonadales bacterium]